MPDQRSKEHRDHQSLDAFKSINSLMRQLKQDIGMDDRYIALMLDALSREYSSKRLEEYSRESASSIRAM